MTEFQKFANLYMGINPMTLHKYESAVDSFINPTVIEERRQNVAAMDVFSRLMMDRIIFLGVPIDDDVANIIQAQFLFLESQNPKEDISLYINTPGGHVNSGLGIYDTMQLIEPEVSTICTGMAASMGSVLLCAGAKGKRTALPHSRVMIHQPLGGVRGQASDIMIAAKEIEKTREALRSSNRKSPCRRRPRLLAYCPGGLRIRTDRQRSQNTQTQQNNRITIVNKKDEDT